MPESQAKDADKLRQESEQLFERAEDKYADVNLPFRGTVGEARRSVRRAGLALVTRSDR